MHGRQQGERGRQTGKQNKQTKQQKHCVCLYSHEVSLLEFRGGRQDRKAEGHVSHSLPLVHLEDVLSKEQVKQSSREFFFLFFFSSCFFFFSSFFFFFL